MALQDIPQYNLPDIGYPYGSPEYLKAIMPFLQEQLQKQAQEANNARGGLYSGPAMANEQEAGSNLLYQMTSAGAQQAAAEQQMKEQQAFQQQMQQEAEQAQANVAREQGVSGQKAGAVSGGLGSLGTLGGLALMKGMGGGGQLTEKQLEALLAKYQAGGAGGAAPGAAGAAGAPVDVASYSMGGGNFGAGTSGIPYAAPAGAPGVAGAPVNAASSPFMGGAFAPGMPGVGTAALSLPGAIYGHKAGARTYGEGTSGDIGSGLGGLAGMIGGSMLGGPLGGAAGAAAGSFLGQNYGQHPGLALLGPAGLPFMIPGVGHAVQKGLLNPIEHGLGDAAHGVGNWLSHAFHF